MTEKQVIDEELYKNHENRPDLAGEHPIGDLLQLIAAILFIAVIILDYIFLKTTNYLGGVIPLYIRLPLGLGILAFGGWLALRGIQIIFREYRLEPVMITEGMFSKVRHPVYLGAMLVYVGIIILTLSLFGVIVFIFVMLLYHWLAKYEERLMIGIFSEAYQEYIKRVPMWLPKIF